MVMHALLDATWNGLGGGETPIFPIQILKMKTGVTFSKNDYNKMVNNEIDFDNCTQDDFEAPNFDIFVKACKVSAKRLFPTFSNLDVDFNQHEEWDANDPERWKKEIAYMGCRTRVFEDVTGITGKTCVGRGNLSFTSINLVAPAIDVMNKYDLQNNRENNLLARKAMREYMSIIEETTESVCHQLRDRFEFQCKAKAKQFPFLIGQGIFTNGETLDPNDSVGDVIRHGTLSVGFIGLAEALVALTGKHHGESESSWEHGYEIVSLIREVTDDFKRKEQLNYSVIATPAEGLAGRFTKIDKKKYGVIEGITDRDYYTNSAHIPVYYSTSAVDKIKKEAPFHKLCNAGHIAYVEGDGDMTLNPLGLMTIVAMFLEYGIGYGAINCISDRCPKCSYDGVIEEDCPKCGLEEKHIERIRRITGYLVGTLDRWNSGKVAEYNDRVKHFN